MDTKVATYDFRIHYVVTLFARINFIIMKSIKNDKTGHNGCGSL